MYWPNAPHAAWSPDNAAPKFSSYSRNRKSHAATVATIAVAASSRKPPLLRIDPAMRHVFKMQVDTVEHFAVIINSMLARAHCTLQPVDPRRAQHVECDGRRDRAPLVAAAFLANLCTASLGVSLMPAQITHRSISGPRKFRFPDIRQCGRCDRVTRIASAERACDSRTS